MKKFVIGLVSGILLAISMTVFAEDVENMIGKKVDGTFAFKINGKRAEKDVVVIEGTSYIPVRAAASLFGYEIDFDEATKEVHMQSKKYKGLSDFDKALSEIIEYDYKTTVPGLVNTDHQLAFFEYNNQQYVGVSPIFAKAANWDGKTMTISLNGVILTGTYESKEIGDLIHANGSFFVKLSALGLKATVQGDTLVIDKQ